MAEAAAAQTISEEERLRANWYAILGWVLSGPPDGAGLEQIASLRGERSEFGEAVEALAATAGGVTPEAVAQEYFDLFIGISRGELLPYASYYLTGFLHEKPLARLRGDMRALGIEREAGIVEPEDHIASLCEIMGGLITGAFGAPAGLAVQRRFYDTHIGCWAPRLFEDLRAAKAARFYVPVGTLGSLFLGVEAATFDMAA